MNKQNFGKNHIKNIKKIKSTKTNLKKNKKKHVGKHCSNPQCFKEKNSKAKISNSSILKKIKSTKTILKKKYKKLKKKEDNFGKKRKKM
jgi:hypothetical protein